MSSIALKVFLEPLCGDSYLSTAITLYLTKLVLHRWLLPTIISLRKEGKDKHDLHVILYLKFPLPTLLLFIVYP